MDGWRGEALGTTDSLAADIKDLFLAGDCDKRREDLDEATLIKRLSSALNAHKSGDAWVVVEGRVNSNAGRERERGAS